MGTASILPQQRVEARVAQFLVVGGTLSISPQWSGRHLGPGSPHLASIVDDAEIRFVLQLLGLLELGVSALLLHHLLHEALVGGFGEPALLIQQGQDAWRASLEKHSASSEWL